MHHAHKHAFSQDFCSCAPTPAFPIKSESLQYIAGKNERGLEMQHSSPALYSWQSLTRTDLPSYQRHHRYIKIKSKNSTNSRNSQYETTKRVNLFYQKLGKKVYQTCMGRASISALIATKGGSPDPMNPRTPVTATGYL